MNRERYSDMLRSRHKPAIKENKPAVVCCLLAYVFRMATSGIMQPVIRETDLGFKTGGVTPSAVFTRFDTQ